MSKIIYLFFIFSIAFVTVSAQEKITDETIPNFQIIGGRWFQKVWMHQVNNHNTFEPKNGISTGGYTPMDLEWKAEKFFVYEAAFKNETGRKIKGFAWHYVFSDLESKIIIQHHKFMYARNIGKGKKVTMQGQSDSPPTNLISADELKKNARSPYYESIEVKCVIFSDNTTWKSKDTPETECEELRRIIKQREETLKRL